MRCVPGSYKAGIFVPLAVKAPRSVTSAGKDVGSVSISGKA